MKKILTIIIPTYNMEKYLRRCLDSLIIDEEGMKQLEVLVINDGSKDSSSQIAHEYQDKYPDTFRVIDKENGNYGSCINRGLKEATGKYVKVLDADDWFDNECFAKYIVFLKSVECDMVLTSFNRVYDNGRIINSTIWEVNGNKEFSVENLPLRNIEMHAITYKTEMLISMKYNQTEGISYTDTEWSIIPLQKVSKCITCPLNLYQYLIGRIGQTVQVGLYERNYWQCLLICDKIIKECQIEKMSCGAYKYITYKFYYFLEGIYRAAIIGNYGKNLKPLIDFDKNLKLNYVEIYDRLSTMIISQRYPIRYIYLLRKKDYRIGLSFLGVYLLLNKIRSLFRRG